MLLVSRHTLMLLDFSTMYLCDLISFLVHLLWLWFTWFLCGLFIYIEFNDVWSLVNASISTCIMKDSSQENVSEIFFWVSSNVGLLELVSLLAHVLTEVKLLIFGSLQTPSKGDQHRVVFVRQHNSEQWYGCNTAKASQEKLHLRNNELYLQAPLENLLRNLCPFMNVGFCNL